MRRGYNVSPRRHASVWCNLGGGERRRTPREGEQLVTNLAVQMLDVLALGGIISAYASVSLRPYGSGIRCCACRPCFARRAAVRPIAFPRM